MFIACKTSSVVALSFVSKPLTCAYFIDVVVELQILHCCDVEPNVVKTR